MIRRTLLARMLGVRRLSPEPLTSLTRGSLALMRGGFYGSSSAALAGGRARRSDDATVNHSWTILGGAWLALALRLGGGEPASTLPTGEVVSYTFRAPPVNALGVGSLADLRGRPVLIEFWGRR